jgi:hypothetical protein
MNTHPDVERIVTEWLHDDVTTAGSDKVLAGALVRVASVRQERIPRPERLPVMNAYAKLAIGLAAAVVVSVVAYNLLPGNGMGSIGTPMATVSPSVLPSPAPSSPATTPGADVWPVGALGVAPHDARLLGVSFSFTMPSPDWRVERGDGTLETGAFPQTSFAWLFFGGPNTWVNTDPCAGKRAMVGPSIDEQAAALTTIDGTDAVGPTDVAVGGRPAKLVVLTIHPDVPCAVPGLELYGKTFPGGGTTLYPNSLTSTIKVWFVDIGGQVLMIHSDQLGPNPKVEQEIQQVVDSIRFE